MWELYSLKNIVEAKEQKWVEKMIDNVCEKIYWKEKNNLLFKDSVRKISSIYFLMKQKFSEVQRDDWERYFEHLRAVANIVLELENPNIEKVLIALLHDSIEDTNIDYHTLKILFWEKIALAVQALSKADESEYEAAETLSAKEVRNMDYFSHLESFETMKSHIEKLVLEDWLDLSEQDLIEITKNTIDVKLADRIHNLSTQWDENNISKVERKLEETKKYFLNIAKEVNIDAYEKIKTLILKLELKLVDFNGKVDKLLEKETVI